jgi:NADH:ubiquinone oxidoreductase subunit F (NADH-binding)
MTGARLFTASDPSLDEHLRCFGVRGRPVGAGLARLLTDAGLSGRGGAGFPTGRKVAAVSGRNAVVIGNAAEGEPLSSKDAALLRRSPHLVFDGLSEVTAAVGARQAYLYLPGRLFAAARRAQAERDRAGYPELAVTLVEAPDRFVAGEESAVIRRIEGGPAVPRDRVKVVAESGLRGAPTMVGNVETLAHIALIARFGARWFRSIGDAANPGTMLVTLSGTPTRDLRVVEVPTGTPLAEVLGFGAVDHRQLRAVLVGGYHGSWVPAHDIQHARLTHGHSIAPGAGIVHTLELADCGLARTADIVAYLAGEAAGQCGPCANGLPALARLFGDLAAGRAGPCVVEDIRRLAGLVAGRGACRHPDGTARLIASALTTFACDVDLHLHGGCEGLRR